MNFDQIIASAKADVGSAAARLERAEKALADAKALRVNAASVAGLFKAYSDERASVYGEWLDKCLHAAADELDREFFDLLRDPNSTDADADALHYLMGHLLQAAIEQRCKKLFPASGPTIAEKREKIAKAENELAAARDALSAAHSTLNRLQPEAPAAGHIHGFVGIGNATT